MTVENNTVGNPVKLSKWLNPNNRKSIVFDIATGMKTFTEQKPGTVVVEEVQTEVGQFVNKWYKCTKYKTLYGEPIWAELTESGAAVSAAYYIFVKQQQNSKTVLSKQFKGNRQQYQGTTKRIPTEHTLNSLNIFYFQKVNAKELSRIQGSADYDVKDFLTEVPDADFLKTTNQALADIPRMYRYMKTDSNGRTTFGVGAKFGTTSYKIIEANRNFACSAGTAASAQFVTTQQADAAITAAGLAAARAAAKSSSNTRGGARNNPAGDKSSGAVKTVINIKSKEPFTRANVDLKKIEEMPYMKQVINHFSAAENSRQSIERYHAFEMMPNSFEFSQLSSAWNEVARSGNYPLVDWSNYQLTKVSFRFLVVAKQLLTTEEKNAKGVVTKTTQSIVNDGLFVSIDEQLDNIRAMAGTPSPITLYNLNNLLTTTYRYPYTNNARNMQWVINDASITATRLTQGGKHISAAEVSLTLTEFPIIGRDIVPLPPLTPDNPPPPACKPDSGDAKCTPVNPEYGLFIEGTYTRLKYTDVIVSPTGKAT